MLFVCCCCQDVLDLLLTGTAGSLSAAKRYRLRCLKPVILMLDRPDCQPVTVASEEAGAPAQVLATPEARRQHVVAALLGEVILATKETNTKTRTAAYELLIKVSDVRNGRRPRCCYGRDPFTCAGHQM